jgi:hypothetical protein
MGGSVKIFQHGNQVWRAELTAVLDGGGLRDHLVTFRCLETATCVAGRTSMSPDRMSQPQLVAALVRVTGLASRHRQRSAPRPALGTW